MPAVTIKRTRVRKPITITYNDWSDHTVKVMNENKMDKLLAYLIWLWTLVTFVAKSNRKTIKSYS